MYHHPIKLSAIFAAIMLVTTTLAQSAGHRPDTRTLSCAIVVSLVQSRGAVLLSTGRYTYDKYVKNHAYCNVNEAIKRAFVPTADNNRCNVGYICKEKFRFFD